MNVPENRTPDGKKMSLKFYPTNERITMSQRSRNASMTRLESRFLVSRLTLRNDVMTRLQSRFYRMTEPGLRSRKESEGFGWSRCPNNTGCRSEWDFFVRLQKVQL